LAVTQTATSRAIFAIPILFPAIILFAMERAKVMPKRFIPLTTLQMSLLFLNISIAIPLGTAYYPTVGKI